MVGGASSFGGGPTMPPTINETDSQGIVAITKKHVMNMVLDTLKEVVPFSQLEYDAVFKYQAEADRPTLHPLLHLRISGAEPEVIDEEKWQNIYHELFEALPENVKEWITWEMNKPFEDRDPSYVMVNNVLTTAARVIGWLSNVTQPVQANSRAEQSYVLNVALPFVALRSITAQTENILNAGNSWLNSVGANYPHHDSLISYLTQVGDALSRLENLREQVESGNTGPEIRQSFIEVAYEFDRLSTLYHATSLGNEFSILGAQLDALATVSAAWALTSGSPSLLLGTSIATIGLTSDASVAGFIGSTYNDAFDSLLGGIFNSVVFGPRAELDELVGLYNLLTQLR